MWLSMWWWRRWLVKWSNSPIIFIDNRCYARTKRLSVDVHNISITSLLLFYIYKMSDSFEKNGKRINRVPCQVYTRVMWYLRPVSHYNLGKKSEFYSRKYFSNEKSIAESNKEFVRKRVQEAESR